MEAQKKDNYCGPASIFNAVTSLKGRSPSQEKIAKLAGTTDEGTDETDMIRAILALGFEADVWKSNNIQESIDWLTGSLGRGRPVILCVDNWLHWCCVFASRRGIAFIFDPANEPYLKKVNHVAVLYLRDLKKRWAASRRTVKQVNEDHSLYGIAICKRYQ